MEFSSPSVMAYILYLVFLLGEKLTAPPLLFSSLWLICCQWLRLILCRL